MSLVWIGQISTLDLGARPRPRPHLSALSRLNLSLRTLLPLTRDRATPVPPPHPAPLPQPLSRACRPRLRAEAPSAPPPQTAFEALAPSEVATTDLAPNAWCGTLADIPASPRPADIGKTTGHHQLVHYPSIFITLRQRVHDTT